MEFKELSDRAIEIQNLYRPLEIESSGKPWTFVERSQGMAGDVGDFMKLVMAKAGTRKYKGTNIDSELAHELSDILWTVLVIADELSIDIENEFIKTMNELETKIEKGEK